MMLKSFQHSVQQLQKTRLLTSLHNSQTNMAERSLRVPYTFYVKRDGATYFLVNRDLIFLIRDS